MRARVRWDHVNFFGGARQAGFEGALVVARSRRAGQVPRAVLLSPAPVAQLRRAGVACATSRSYTSGHARRPRHRPPPDEHAEFWSVVAHQRVSGAATIAGRGAGRPDDPGRADCARPRPARPARRAARSAAMAFDVGRNTTNNLLDARRGYVLNAHASSRRAAGSGDRTTTGRRRSRGATTCRSRRRFVWRTGVSVGVDRSGRTTSTPTCRSTSVSSSVARQAIAAGAASRSPRSSERLADWRAVDARWRRRRCGFRSWGSSAASAFLDYGNVWVERVGIELGRSAIRRRSGPPLSDADRPGAHRLRLPAESDRGPARQRRAAEAAAWRVHFSIGQAF